MNASKLIISVSVLAIIGLLLPRASLAQTDGQSYEALVTLYDDFLQWQDEARAKRAVPNRDIAGEAAQLYPDYGDEAVALRLDEMEALQRRFDTIEPEAWSTAQQVDYLAVRSRLDQHEFTLSISRPWARDPGFYVDRMLRVTFADLPLNEDDTAVLRTRLAAIALLAEAGKENLDEVAADYADLALFNLTNADGVGHGYPYRATPPAGVIGWYEDFLARAREAQPALVPDIESTQQAVVDFNQWLKDNRPTMTAEAGVGKEHFNWYLKHVKLMPYDTEQIVTLGLRELDRLWAVYGLEQHRNRDLPPLLLSESEEEYKRRIAAIDTMIREFLVESEIITVPDDIGELATNAPWIVRSNGPNFWEQVQFRDPTPDHLHAVIPGHRFDGVLEQRNEHPIRGRLMSGARAEGWATYLEEAMMHAGLDMAPRTRELIYIFGIFRAARVPADVWLQTNEMTVDEAVTWWRERVPYLDEDVARVDAEIYLRRPPGYGLGYTIGMLQMQRLLADRKRQLGDDFVLKDFHDTFMESGRLPLSLLRWEMTGQDDEIVMLWPRERLAEVR
ncbi:MAG: DUF885 family protein [Woeseiaceae bacterium]